MAISASEIPDMTELAPVALGFLARSPKARMIPSTVPKRPMNGALFPSVARKASRDSYSSRDFLIAASTTLATLSAPLSACPSAALTTSASMPSRPSTAARALARSPFSSQPASASRPGSFRAR